MDFSAFNPKSTNALNRAARSNDLKNVKRLLKKCNPNCVDNRGWTSLHEAAANDSYESMLLIIKHPQCRPLAETYEGHTALYLACKNQVSFKTIKALLGTHPDISKYASTELVTPLHVASVQGRNEVVQLLLDHSANINGQDFDGDTALHDAAYAKQHETVSLLLHAGALPEILNSEKYTPFHLACSSGCLDTVKALYPFIIDINMRTGTNETPLSLATYANNIAVVLFLLENNADPHLRVEGELAIDMALQNGNSELFLLLLSVTNCNEMRSDSILVAMNPTFFNMDIIITLFESDLGHEFFNSVSRDFLYRNKGPLTVFLDVIEYIYDYDVDIFEKLFYLYLMRGISVNLLDPYELPPLAHYSFCPHANSSKAVLRIMLEQGVDVDWNSGWFLPDAFVTSLRAGPDLLPLLQQHSLACDPETLITSARDAALLDAIPTTIQNQILALADVNSEGLTVDNMFYFVPTLKHLARRRVRQQMRAAGVRTTRQYTALLNALPLPKKLLTFLTYN